MRRVTYTKAALKTLSRMPTNTVTLLRAKIDQYAANPLAQANNVKALKGEFGDGSGRLRLRVGDWRVLLTETHEVVAIIKVGPRGGIYG